MQKHHTQLKFIESIQKKRIERILGSYGIKISNLTIMERGFIYNIIYCLHIEPKQDFTEYK